MKKATLKRISKFLILFISFCGFSAFGQNTLRELAQSKGIQIGAAVNPSLLTNDSVYKKILAQEFNTIVCENHMKWKYLQPERNNFTFNTADSMVNFAIKNSMKIRGHVFVWHHPGPNPAWVASETNRDSLLKKMEQHITTVMKHYKGKVYEWDIVNEAFDDAAKPLLRNSFWKNVIGPSFIDSAFTYARRADSSCLLFYNDYSIEHINAKSDSLYAFVKKMKERNVPIDGIGFQCHYLLNQLDTASFAKNIKRFKALGLKVSITEVDIAINLPLTPEKLQAQKVEYKNLMLMAMRENITTFLLWGFTDKASWIPQFYNYTKGGALIYDSLYQPKPSYYGLQEALKQGTVPVSPKSKKTSVIKKVSKQKNIHLNLKNKSLPHKETNSSIVNAKGMEMRTYQSGLMIEN